MTVAPLITSRQNMTVKRARALARGQMAQTPYMCVEGLRIMEEALVEGIRFDVVLVSPRLEATERGAAMRENLIRSGNPLLEATDDVLSSISDAAGDQGIVGVAFKREWRLDQLFAAERAPLVVVAWGVQDPGNLGTIFRTVDAVGASGIILTAHSAGPYNTKTVRATMGAIFRVPFVQVEDGLETLVDLRSKRVRIIATELESTKRHMDVDFTRPCALILGGEGGGVPGHVIDLCDESVRIPIREGVESLNVSSAAAVMLYEAARQRGYENLI